MLNLSSKQLRRAANLKDKIESLQKELGRILGASTPAQNGAAPKRKMSAAGRRKIAAAARARWAKVKGRKSAAKPVKKARRTMSAAARAIKAAARSVFCDSWFFFPDEKFRSDRGGSVYRSGGNQGLRFFQPVAAHIFL